MDCPPDSAFVALLEDALDRARTEHLEEHIDACPRCRRLLSELARLTSREAPDPAEHFPLPHGTTIDRYELRDAIGSGTTGRVYAAYDPKLRRLVALKLWREPQVGEAPTVVRVREAEIVAQLSHPNVVTMHDFGRWQDHVYVVMELVDGVTLRSWLDSDREVHHILAVLIDAGRGLAAAHGAGLVHRDFKPDNVLVGRDGRVRVGDFGLARVLSATSVDPDRAEPSTRAPASPNLTLDPTETRAVAGTPLYMSPEQHLGRPATPRSDQFSFGVALYEALIGSHPFCWTHANELAEAVRAGRRRPWPSRPRVARRVRHVIDRGLNIDPERRFASMDALLGALDRPAPARRRSLALLGIASAAAVGMTTWNLQPSVMTEAMANSHERPCDGGADELATVWNHDRRAASIDGWTRSTSPRAAVVGDRVSAAIDDYATRWTAAHLEACESTRRGTQPQALLDLRIRCLQRRLVALDVLLDEWGREIPNEAAVMGAVAAVRRLPAIASCSELSTLLAPRAIEPSAAAQQAIETVHRTVAASRAADEAGQPKRAIELATAAREAAAALGHRPTEAEAIFAAALSHANAGEIAKAEALYEEAFTSALAANHVEIAGRSGAALAIITATRGHADEAAAQWLKRSFAALEQYERAEALPEVRAAAGIVAVRAGRLDEAQRQLVAARRGFVEMYGPHHPEVGRTTAGLANVYMLRGAHTQAEPLYVEALQIAEALFGAEHPRVGAVLNGMGGLYHRLGRLELAQRTLERALAIFEAHGGPDDRSTLSASSNLALVELERGNAAGARLRLEHVLEAHRRRDGARHPQVAQVLHDVAMCDRALRQPRRARQGLEDALRITRAARGPEHQDVAAHLFELGELDRDRGECRSATRRYRDALAIWTRELFPDDKRIVRVREAMQRCAG